MGGKIKLADGAEAHFKKTFLDAADGIVSRISDRARSRSPNVDREIVDAFLQGADAMWGAVQREQLKRANAVLQVLREGDQEIDLDAVADGSVTAWAGRLDEAVAGHLDHRSVRAFVELIWKQTDSERQALRAALAHREHRQMKDYAFKWLDDHFEIRGAKLYPKSGDRIGGSLDKQKRRADTGVDRDWITLDNVARALEGVVNLEWRTLRAYVTEWKKLRATGRP